MIRFCIGCDPPRSCVTQHNSLARPSLNLADCLISNLLNGYCKCFATLFGVDCCYGLIEAEHQLFVAPLCCRKSWLDNLDSNAPALLWQAQQQVRDESMLGRFFRGINTNPCRSASRLGSFSLRTMALGSVSYAVNDGKASERQNLTSYISRLHMIPTIHQPSL